MAEEQISNNLVTLISASTMSNLKSGNIFVDMIITILFIIMLPVLIKKVKGFSFKWWENVDNCYSMNLIGKTISGKNGYVRHSYSESFRALSKYIENLENIKSLSEFYVESYKKKSRFLPGNIERLQLTKTIYCQINHQIKEDQGGEIINITLKSNKSLTEIQDFLKNIIREYNDRMSDELEKSQKYFCPNVCEESLQWKVYNFVSNKNMFNMYFNAKDDVLKSIDNFTNDKEKYQKLGIPWTLGILLHGAPGCGKCLAKDTPILMFDGKIKPVQDIKIGDVIMGDDSTPRNILSLARGREKMYRVLPNKGDPYIVNESHILSLRMSCPKFITRRNKSGVIEYIVRWHNSDGTPHSKIFSIKKYGTLEFAKNTANKFLASLENVHVVIDIPLKEYLEKEKEWKEKWKGYRVGINFEKGEDRPGLIDPYLLGLWVSNGTSNKPEIANVDQEILNYLSEEADNMNLRIIKRQETTHYFADKEHMKNIFLQELSENHLLDNKHIPLKYKTASRNCRLSVLAGIIDSNGHHHQGNYNIIQKNKNLTEDILYLARSCGLAAYANKRKKECREYHIVISGNITDIPVKIKRKRIDPRKINKNVLNVDISVEPLEEDDYYGFMIDGNHRFVLGDFTVTHNTSFVKALANYTRRHIIEIPLNRIKTYGALKEVMLSPDIAGFKIPFEKRLYLMEDIDCLDKIVLSRKEKTDNDKDKKPGIHILDNPKFKCKSFSNDDTLTLSHILNIIDGPLETPGRILVITSNHPEKLDKALVRDGRMDIKLKMEPIEGKSLHDMIHTFFPNEEIPVLTNPLKMSPATIQNLCFNNSFTKVIEVLK